MSSSVQFDRWNPKDEYSRPYISYNAQTGELRRMYVSMLDSKSYVYSSLKKDGATWGDKPGKYFAYPNGVKKTRAYSSSLKEWSDSFNQFCNWNNLNVLLAVNSIFETYMVKVIALALESDIGVIYGMSRSIDGIKAIKSGYKFNLSKSIESCTKGTWSSRNSNIRNLFGSIPTIFETKCGILDGIRVIRNDVAHSFGKDLEKAHDPHEILKLGRTTLTNDQLLKKWEVLDTCAHDIDDLLFKNHIGEYINLYIYHMYRDDIIKELNDNNTPDSTGSRARIFRKLYGKLDSNGVMSLGKEFSTGLVRYYESL